MNSTVMSLAVLCLENLRNLFVFTQGKPRLRASDLPKVPLEAGLRLRLRCPESKFYFFILYCFLSFFFNIIINLYLCKLASMDIQCPTSLS